MWKNAKELAAWKKDVRHKVYERHEGPVGPYTVSSEEPQFISAKFQFFLLTRHMESAFPARPGTDKLIFKVLPPDYLYDNYETEQELHMALDNAPYLATGWGFVELMDSIGLFMRWFECGDLLEAVLAEPLPRDTVWLLIGDILRGLAELHRNGYVHCNVKLENILLTEMDIDSDGTQRLHGYLTGFSHVKSVSESGTISVSKERLPAIVYRPPEMFVQDDECVVDEKVDTWMLGLVAYAALTGEFLFPSQEPDVCELSIRSWKNDFSQAKVTDDDIVRLKMFLEPDPTLRPSARELLRSGEFGSFSEAEPEFILPDASLPQSESGMLN